MNGRLCLAIVIAALGSFIRPVSAIACSCGGTSSSPASLRAADLVFVGTVARVDGGPKARSRANAEGSVSVGFGTEPPITTFEVTHLYRGRGEQRVVIVGNGGDCDVPFKQGQMWLVYARLHNGRAITDTCTRTRLRAEAEASHDLAYLDGVERGRAQGVVSGGVNRRIVGADGQPVLQALFEPLQVIAASASGRVQITTDKWGPYQLVLPPGDFEIWVERGGRAVTRPQTIRINHGSDRRLALVVEYQD